MNLKDLSKPGANAYYKKHPHMFDHLIPKPKKQKRIKTWKDCPVCHQEFLSLNATTCPDCVKRRAKQRRIYEDHPKAV